MAARSSAFSRRFTRRLAGGALLAFQAVIAGSWVVEPVGPVRLGAHMEDFGARHTGLHNEATCLACAVRVMHAVPARTPEPVGETPVRQFDGSAPATPDRETAARDTNLSRAPPVAA